MTVVECLRSSKSLFRHNHTRGSKSWGGGEGKGGGGSDYTLTPALHSGGSVVGRSVTDPVVIYVSGPCSISGAVDPDTAMGTHRAWEMRATAPPVCRRDLRPFCCSLSAPLALFSNIRCHDQGLPTLCLFVVGQCGLAYPSTSCCAHHPPFSL